MDLIKSELIEKLADFDDDLMHAYLEGEPITPEKLLEVARFATIHSYITPVFCGAALPNIGVTTFLQSIVDLIPSPKDVGNVKAEDLEGNPVELKASEDEGLCALVFKTMIDPYIGKMNYIRNSMYYSDGCNGFSRHSRVRRGLVRVRDLGC